jgi:hypothetical protein
MAAVARARVGVVMAEAKVEAVRARAAAGKARAAREVVAMVGVAWEAAVAAVTAGEVIWGEVGETVVAAAAAEAS